jgi:uncharacterized protein (TIGR00730 family)
MSGEMGEPTRLGRATVAVFGSARLTADDERWSLAYRLGGLLAEAGYAVMTGGYGGLMAAVGRGAYERGGTVIGVPMRHWQGVQPHPWQSELRWVGSYGERLNQMLSCEAAIALPGGVGTLAELALCWAAAQTEGRRFPLILLGACWPPVVASMAASLVVDEADLALLRFANDPEEALRLLIADDLARPGRQHG